MRILTGSIALLLSSNLALAQSEAPPPNYDGSAAPQQPQQPPPTQYPPAAPQQPPSQYPPRTAPPPAQYPPAQQQYPQQQYPQQPYQYPPAQQPYQYPQQQYQPSQQPLALQPQYAPPVVSKLALTSRNPAVTQLAWQCSNALDLGNLDGARAKCTEALRQDPSVAIVHAWLAIASTDEGRVAAEKSAQESLRGASPAEQLYVQATIADLEGRSDEARGLYDRLVAAVATEPRAYVARGQFKQRRLNDLDGALADYKKALEVDPQYAFAYRFIAMALVERGQFDEASAAAKQLATMLPQEAAAQLFVAEVSLHHGNAVEAAAAAQRALTLDPKSARARALYGDALLFTGKGKEARREYAALLLIEDPAVHHEAAMKEARSWIFEGRSAEAEKSLDAEQDFSRRNRRPLERIQTMLELARLQFDRGALADAGKTLRGAATAFMDKESTLTDIERRRLLPEILTMRAMLLAAIGERQLAEGRAEELGGTLRTLGDPQAQMKATALKGWIAVRTGDDQGALVDLAVATRPTMRMALALVAVRGGDTQRAKAIMEELGRRMENDLETALTRPRAIAWLKNNGAGITDASSSPAPSAASGQSSGPVGSIGPLPHKQVRTAPPPAPTVAPPKPAPAPSSSITIMNQ